MFDITHSFKSSVTHLSYLCQSWLGSLARFGHLYSWPPATHLLSCLWCLLTRSYPHHLKPACLCLCPCSQYASRTQHVQHIPSLINFFPIKEIRPLELFPANWHASHCSHFCPIFCPPPCMTFSFNGPASTTLSWLGWGGWMWLLVSWTWPSPSTQPQNAPSNSHWAYLRLEPTYKTKQTTPVSPWWSPWSPGQSHQSHQSCWTAENDQQTTQEGPSKRSVLSFLYIPCFFFLHVMMCLLSTLLILSLVPTEELQQGESPTEKLIPRSSWPEGNSWSQWTYSPWLQSSNWNAFD